MNMSAKLAATPEQKSSTDKKRYRKRVDRSERKTAADTLLQFSGHVEVEHASAASDSDLESGTAVQTDINQSLFTSMQDELQNLRTDNAKLADCMSSHSSKFPQSDFDGDDEKVKYFTGLPKCTILLALFTFLEHSLPTKQSLDKFPILIMCFKRLRLYLPLQLLSFNVSISSVSRFLFETIDVMYIKMKSLVNWPEREYC